MRDAGMWIALVASWWGWGVAIFAARRWRKTAASKDRQILAHQRQSTVQRNTIRTQAEHLALLKGVIDEQNKRDYPIKEER